MKALRLYSRPHCHLCEQLADSLAPIIAGRAHVELVDIDADPKLVERYWLRIPVLVGGEQEISEYPLDVEALELYLAANDG